MCVCARACVCVCVGVREREREGKNGREREERRAVNLRWNHAEGSQQVRSRQTRANKGVQQGCVCHSKRYTAAVDVSPILDQARELRDRNADRKSMCLASYCVHLKLKQAYRRDCWRRIARPCSAQLERLSPGIHTRAVNVRWWVLRKPVCTCQCWRE